MNDINDYFEGFNDKLNERDLEAIQTLSNGFQRNYKFKYGCCHKCILGLIYFFICYTFVLFVTGYPPIVFWPYLCFWIICLIIVKYNQNEKISIHHNLFLHRIRIIITNKLGIKKEFLNIPSNTKFKILEEGNLYQTYKLYIFNDHPLDTDKPPKLYWVINNLWTFRDKYDTKNDLRHLIGQEISDNEYCLLGADLKFFKCEQIFSYNTCNMNKYYALIILFCIFSAYLYIISLLISNNPEKDNSTYGILIIIGISIFFVILLSICLLINGNKRIDCIRESYSYSFGITSSFALKKTYSKKLSFPDNSVKYFEVTPGCCYKKLVLQLENDNTEEICDLINEKEYYLKYLRKYLHQILI